MCEGIAVSGFDSAEIEEDISLHWKVCLEGMRILEKFVDPSKHAFFNPLSSQLFML